MKEGRFSWKFFSIIFVFFFYLFQYLANWPILAFFHLRGMTRFEDLRSILHASGCFRNIGMDVYQSSVDPTCGYAYGQSLVRILSFLHLDDSSTIIIGIIFMIALLTSITFYISFSLKLLAKRNLILVLGACSPPAILLMERGNIDILVFLTIIFIFFSRSKKTETLGFLLIALTATFKFYTLPLLFLLLFKSTTKKIFLWRFFVVLGTSALIINDIKLIRGTYGFPEPTQLAFGSPLIGLELNHWAGFDLTANERILLGVLVLALLILVRLLYQRIRRVSFFLSERRELNFERSIEFFGFTFLSCWLSGMSFDYRLIYLLPIGSILLSRTSSKNSLLFGTGTFLAMWMSFEIYKLQFLGDFLIYGLLVRICFELLPIVFDYPILARLRLNQAAN